MLLSGTGTADIWRLIYARSNRFGARIAAMSVILIVLIAVSPLVKPLLKISYEFSQDNRKLFQEWISRNVPDSAVILEGRRVRLKYAIAFSTGNELSHPDFDIPF